MNTSLCLAICILSSSYVFGQSSSSNRTEAHATGGAPIESEVMPLTELHYAGTYHVASGVFEPASGAQPPASTQGVIYNNTCKVAGGLVQSALNGSTYIDDGRIPSTTSPAPNTGTLNNYRVNKLQIAYAVRDVTGSPFSIRFRVWDHFLQDASSCTSFAAAGTPIVSYNFTGLPGATVQGQLTGYVLDVDLIGAEFCIHGDANGVYDLDGYGNGFGYGLTLAGQSGTTAATAGGFFVAGLAGGSGACAQGEGTYYDNPSSLSGTGLDDDLTWYRNGQSGQTSGCFTFGGAATGAAGFWLVMRAQLDACSACPGNPPSCGSPGATICQPGIANVMTCPCLNPPASAGLGCNNSANTGGGQLAATGHASLSTDSLVFTTSGEKPTATSIVLQGNNVSTTGTVFGQGVSCIAGTLKRLYVKTAAGGSITAPQGPDPVVHTRSAALGDTIAAGTHRYYGVYYRDPNVLGGCPGPSTFNITQQMDVLWML